MRTQDPITGEELRATTKVSQATLRAWIQRGLVSRPMKVGGGRGKGTGVFYPKRAIQEIRRVQRKLDQHVTLQEQAQAVSTEELERRRTWYFRGSPPKMVLSFAELAGRVRQDVEGLTQRSLERIIKTLVDRGFFAARGDREDTVAFAHEEEARIVVSDLARAIDASGDGNVRCVLGSLRILEQIRILSSSMSDRQEDWHVAVTEEEKLEVERDVEGYQREIDRLERLLE